MNTFYSDKKFEILSVILIFIATDIFGVFIIKLVDSYLMLNLITLIMVLFSLFYLYHIGVWFTVKYNLDEDGLVISALGGLKKVIVPLSDIECYTKSHGKIEGISLSGVSSNSFSIGRIVVKLLGTTRMFATGNRNIIYIKTENMNYGITPFEIEKFEAKLNELGIEKKEWTKAYNKVHGFYKEKHFIIPMIICSIIVLVITFLPILLYVMNKLPDVMPLTITSGMKVIKVGTDKQFAFSQMIYGLLNMAVLFCMYYAAHFCAKYDKKVAYRYIYIAMTVAILFLYLQVRLIMMTV